MFLYEILMLLYENKHMSGFFIAILFFHVLRKKLSIKTLALVGFAIQITKLFI